MPKVSASSSLVTIILLAPSEPNRVRTFPAHRRLAVAETSRCTSSAPRGQERAKLVEPRLVVLAAPGRVDEDHVDVGHAVDGLVKLAGGADDPQRHLDDLGVGPELLDGGDAVRVERDQADPKLLRSL